jgi:hypothetical protein
VTNTSSTGRKLPIADDRRQKIIEVIDHPERGKLIKDGLIKRKTNISGKKDSGARLD